MSPLAHVLAARGCHVAGADAAAQSTLEALRRAGIACFVGHDVAQLGDADVLVYSSAIPADNPERRAAHARGIPCLHRGQLLAQLVNDARSITVAGTHGKTTTAALAALIMTAAGFDPTALIGGFVPAFGAYHRVGASPWIVVETDESDGSFQLLDSTIAAMLNIDRDHLDYYADIDAIATAFARYAARVHPHGSLVYNAQDARLCRIAAGVRADITRVACTTQPHAAADLRADNIVCLPWSSRFTVHDAQGAYDVELGLPGRHNVDNALHAIAATRQAGVEPEAVQRACAAFHGVHRRFQVLGEFRGATVIDDYAHHPREIEATIRMARALERPLLVVFQPHRFTRTASLLDDFVHVLGGLERLVLTDIFSAGETPALTSGAVLHERVRAVNPGVVYTPDPADISAVLARMTRPGDLLLFLGAGTISSVAHALAAPAASPRQTASVSWPSYND